MNSDGKRNMPSGEVFTGPHETSAEGTVRFTVPSSPPRRGRRGRHARVPRGHAWSTPTPSAATPTCRRRSTPTPAPAILGELGIGTNFGIDRPIGTILFDEKIGGTVHLALGRSYPETGGTNESAVHWDMICDLRQDGRLTADGVTILENGQFTS